MRVCPINDCTGDDVPAPCCLDCANTDCPERCYKQEAKDCIFAMNDRDLKKVKNDDT